MNKKSIFKRVIKILLRVIGILIVVVLLGAGLFLWRIASEPVSVPLLTNKLESLFDSAIQGYQVKIDRTELYWDRNRDRLLVNVADVDLLTDAGQQMAGLPELSVEVGVSALLKGVFALRSVDLKGTWVYLVRDEEGQVRLAGWQPTAPDSEESGETGEAEEAPADSLPSPGELDTAEAKGDEDELDIVTQVLEALMADADPDRPGTFLTKLRLNGAAMKMEDRRVGLTWQASEMELELDKSTDGLEASLDFQVPLETHSIALQATVKFDQTSGDILADAAFDSLWPPDLVGLTGVERLAGYDLLCGGKFTMRTHVKDPILDLDFNISGAEPEDAQQTGLLMGLEGKATGEVDKTTLQATLTLQDLHIYRLPDYWPAGAVPGARLWITRNIPQGLVTEVKADLSLSGPGGKLQELSVMDFDGSIAYEDLEVHFLRPLPPVTGLTGGGTFDLDSFDLHTGKAALTDLAVDSVQVNITGLSHAKDALALDLVLSGPVRSVMTLLDSPALDLISGLGIVPDKIGGSLATHAYIALPLRGKITLGSVDMRFVGQTRQAVVRDVFQGQDVDQADLQFTVQTAGMDLAGPVRFAGYPQQIHWREAFSRQSDTLRTVQVDDMQFGTDALQNLGIDIQDYCDGIIGGSLDATFGYEGQISLQADLDFKETQLSVGSLWQKEAGLPGSVQASVSLLNGRPVSVDTFQIAAGSLQTSGSIGFSREDGKLERVDLPQFRLGKGEIRQVEFKRLGDALDLKVGGGEFDASGWFKRSEMESLQVHVDEDGTSTPAVSVPDSATLAAEPDTAIIKLPPFVCQLANLEKIWFGDDRYLEDVGIWLNHGDEHWQSIKVTAKLPPGAVRGTAATKKDVDAKSRPFSFHYGPDDQGANKLSMYTDNLGGMLWSMNITDGLQGGLLQVLGTPDQPDAMLPMQLRLRMMDLTTLETSFIMRLLALNVFETIFSEKDKEVTFDRLESSMQWRHGSIYVGYLNMNSSSLGVTGGGLIDYGNNTIAWKGTVIPARKINTTLGKIPLIGKIFSKGEGFMAVDYQLGGALSNPEVGVTPLSAVTPDALKNGDEVDKEGDQEGDEKDDQK